MLPQKEYLENKPTSGASLAVGGVFSNREYIWSSLPRGLTFFVCAIDGMLVFHSLPSPQFICCNLPNVMVFVGGAFGTWLGQDRAPLVAQDKESANNAGDTGEERSISGLGRSSGGGHGNSLQYSCWEIPRTGEPGGYIPRCCRVRHDRSNWASRHKPSQMGLVPL